MTFQERALWEKKKGIKVWLRVLMSLRYSRPSHDESVTVANETLCILDHHDDETSQSDVNSKWRKMALICPGWKKEELETSRVYNGQSHLVRRKDGGFLIVSQDQFYSDYQYHMTIVYCKQWIS